MAEMSIAMATPEQCIPAPDSEDASGFKLTPITEVMKRTLETDWIIKDYLPADSTIMIFGAPASGKSLISMEMAFCVGIGKDYYGHPVKKGAAIYIAGEGQMGINKRFKALTIANGGTADNVLVSELPMDLYSTESLGQVLGAIEHISDVTLIIIDTLHRNSTADENSAKDFAIVMQSCDQLRKATGATILLVHHSGHDGSKRARGSSSMNAALDVEYQVKKVGKKVTMHNTKAKDIETPADMDFTLKPIVVGKSTKGEDISAPVLIQENASKARVILTAEDKKILECLEQLMPSGEQANDGFHDSSDNSVAIQPDQMMVRRKDWFSACKDKINVKADSTNPDEAKRKRFKRSLERLHKFEKIAKNNSDCYIVPQIADAEENH